MTLNCIRFNIPNMINNLPQNVRSKIETHSLGGFNQYMKKYLIDRYDPVCFIENCYICRNVT